MSLNTNNTILLPDKRQLGYAEYGVGNGFPVFMFHGNPGSRLSWGYFPDCPFIGGIRIIAPDRPGYGLSDFKENAIESWPDDICKLADHLGIEKFSVKDFLSFLSEKEIVYDEYLEGGVHHFGDSKGHEIKQKNTTLKLKNYDPLDIIRHSQHSQ